MKCKTLLLSVLTLLFMSLATHAVKAADKSDDPIVDIESLESKADFEQAYETLKEQVQHLKTAKKEAVTKVEKQKVRKEIKEVKKEIKAVQSKALSGGIYIGGGALIVILLLIILL